MILGELLNSVDNSQMLWISPEGRVKAGELKRNIAACRDFIAGNKKLRVALELRDTVSALTWMLALDGNAQAVFLVPESLQNTEVYTDLMQQFGANLTISESLASQAIDLSEGDEGDRTIPAESCTTRWLLATSGTTGTPKLIEHTTDSLTKTCKADVRRGREFVWGLVYDPFRFAGLQVVLQALASGSPLVLCNHIAGIADQATFLSENAVNALSATPTYWRKLLMSGTLRGLNFRQITLGGEPADQSILSALKSAFPSARVAHIYASTEAGVGFSVTDGLAGFPKEYLDGGLSNNKLCIGDSGTLLIKLQKHLPSCSGGASLANEAGCFDTGDLVEVRGDRVFFLGRDSGAINVGGNKVIPEEVEAVIREVEGVGEVLVKPRSSGVVGQLVTADIQPLSSEADKATLKKAIIAHCRERLEKHKVPALIRFVENIHQNTTGKISRS